MFNIGSDDMGTLCVCAIRYCQGRQTYMPVLVQKIVTSQLQKLPDYTIEILLEDCNYQRKYNLYGDHGIDMPNWLEFEKTIKAEQERRKIGKGKR